MQNYTEFGAEARKRMLQKDMTVSSLADKLGISVSYLSEIFKGTRKGDGQKEKIADILGMELPI